VDITVYLPDELGAWAKEQTLGLSRMLRDAVETEKERREAHAAAIAKGEFERVEVYDSLDEHNVAFHGREIGFQEDREVTAYLTQKGAIALHDGSDERLYVYDDYAEFLGDNPAPKLAAQVAGALGENYVEELDI
jgi:hypothetical protein